MSTFLWAVCVMLLRRPLSGEGWTNVRLVMVRLVTCAWLFSIELLDCDESGLIVRMVTWRFRLTS